MLGNRLLDFIGESKKGKYTSASKADIERYDEIINKFQSDKFKRGSNFDVKKWADEYGGLNSDVVDFFSNIQEGDDILEGLANTMGKTTKAVMSSGDEIQLTGNKFKDFFTKTKSSFGTFGKVASNALKGFGKGLLGTAANVGLNLLIGTVIDKAINAWQDYSNVQENAINKSKEAFSAMQENQNKIKNAQGVLDSIKEDTVLDSSGNEITRFEQLSQGVNSLGENISLTKSEFEEYNAILNSMSSAGLTATSSMANLEAQVKNIRRTSNIDSLQGLGEWVEGFNAQNNQLYSDSTKEIGYQQKLSALGKLQNQDIEDIEKHNLWDDISASIQTANELQTAYYSSSKDVEKHLKAADKIQKENVLSRTETEALKSLAKDFSLDLFDKKGEIDTKKLASKEVQKQLADAKESLETEVESMVQQSSGFLQAMFENSPTFDKISSSAANAIGGIFNNIDYDTISKYMMDSNGNLSQKMMKDWVTTLSSNVKDKSVQEQLSQLFSLDADSNKKTFSEYQKQAEGLIDSISSSVPELSKTLLKDSSGISDTLDEATIAYNRVSKTVGKDFADMLSLSNLDLAAEIISTQDVKNAEELKQAMLATKQAAQDINANPIFDSIEVAKKSENKGADYEKATAYLKEAKELYDKGLYDTDDFKSIAKYLSPTGSEDPANFIENYGKAARYLTEDASGVTSFLNDLNKKGYATFENLSDGTQKWSYNIQDLQKAAQDMGMGFEFFMDMFGRLEDYGFSNNFVSSQEDGIQKITDKTTELANAKKELAEMETTGQYTTTDENGNQQTTVANQTAIDAKRAEIAGLENDLNELQINLNQFNQATADSINQQIEKSKQMYTSLKEERDKILSENRYGENTDEVVKGLDEQLKQIAQDGFFEIDGEMNIVNEDEVKSEIESKPIELPVDIDSSFDELKGKAEESLSEVQKLVQGESSFIKLDLDSDSAFDLNNQIVAISSAMSKLQNEDGTIDIHAEGAEEAINVLMALVAKKQEVSEPVIMSVDTGQLDGDLATVIGKLQEFQSAYNELERLNTLQAAGVNVDTSDAQSKLNSITTEIQNLDGKQAEIMAKVVPDTTSVEAISSTLSSMQPEVLVKAGINVDAIANYTPEDKDANVNFHVEDSEIKNYTPESKSAIVKYSPNTSALPTSFSPITRMVNYIATGDTGKGKASGTMLSPAHADGTAYNTLNMSPAHANGKVSLPNDEKALVNEIGMESIVRDGVWQLLPGGAHLEQLKKGDIVFNASQTEQLLKHGSISGHGKAYADGTVGNIRDLVSKPLNAYAVGSGGGILGAGGSGSQANFNKPSYNDNSSSPNNTSKVAKDTAEIAENTESASESAEEFEETLDWIEVTIDRIERNISNLERTAGNTYETLGTRTDALRSQLSEVTNEINIQNKAYDRYLQAANEVGLSEDYAEKVRNGLIDLETITDETLNDSISKYKEYYEKALDCRDAVEELKETVQSLYEESFNNLVDEYDNMLSQIEHRRNILEGYIDQTESQGYIVSTKYYSELIKNEQANLNDLNEKRNALIASLNDAVANGNIKMYSQAWYEMQQEINGCNEAIQDANTSIIEYGNSIRDIKWEVFDKLQDKISGITQESDFLIDLMSNDKLFDDKGKITDQGKATMGLHGVNYNTYMSQADQYRKEIESLQEEINKDPYNQELVDRRKELLELQQESIMAAENEKEAIKDLVEDGINKQLESLQDLIDKYSDMLDSQKDMYDYQQEISEKQKEIASLEKQLSAYAGDDSEEGAANRQDIQNQLDEAKTDLEETQFEKSISEQKKLLDELYSEYEQILNMRLDNIDMLISDVIANVNSESSGIRDTISTEASNVGYQLSESMNTIWGASGTIATILTTYSNNFSSTMTTVQQAINDIRTYIKDAVNASNNKADSNIDNANKNQSEQAKPPSNPTPTPTPKPETSGGDGNPQIGDKVTFMSGTYYYSSDGRTPTGYQNRGQEVYITGINHADWATKQYHLSTGSKMGDGDLGWVSLDQIKGYKNGTKSVNKPGMYWTNEGESEVIIRKSDGALLTPLDLGDKVLKHTASENLFNMANNPANFIHKFASATPSLSSKAFTSTNNTTEVNVNIGIEKVQDYNDFVKQLQTDKKFEKLIESMTVDRMMGKGSLGKRRINF